jgi:hypothetical protein
MAPFDLSGLSLVQAGAIYLGIGISFGFILERAGFGDARKLAAQFYLHDMTVIKVMFTGITTAGLLIAWAAALGWLDLDALWVNPTYIWPGILGGLLLGMGFFIGGY